MHLKPEMPFWNLQKTNFLRLASFTVCMDECNCVTYFLKPSLPIFAWLMVTASRGNMPSKVKSCSTKLYCSPARLFNLARATKSILPLPTGRKATLVVHILQVPGFKSARVFFEILGIGTCLYCSNISRFQIDIFGICILQ